MNKEELDRAEEFYQKHYREVVRISFEQEQKHLLKDHTTESDRVCRFCKRGVPEVTFRKTAHAVPEFLGNRDIISLNECDDCNQFLADEYEDHLGRYTLFQRTASRIPNKTRRTKYKNRDQSLTLESASDLLGVTISDKEIFDRVSKSDKHANLEFCLDTQSQSFVPNRAGKALLKIAVSICPPGILHECDRAVSWLMGQANAFFIPFPVFYLFTPESVAEPYGDVTLLERATRERTPFLVLLVRFKAHRLQTFVPFCPSDKHWMAEGNTKINMSHYPVRWNESEVNLYEHRMYDWSSTEPISVSGKATFNLKGVKVVSPHDGDSQ